MKLFVQKRSFRERLNISRLALQFPRLTIGFWIAVTVAGILAFSSLKYALFPDITFPVIIVNAQAPIATTLETESLLTDSLEQPLQSLERLDELSSTTYPGQSVIRVLFNPGTQIESATERVREALSKVSLPAEASFNVIPIDLNESPAISYAITSETKSLRELSSIAKAEIIPQIEKLSDVLKVNLLGNADERTTENLTKSEEAPPSNGRVSPIFLTRIHFNGQEAIAFQAIKRSQANTLDVVSHVEKVIRSLQAKFPEIKVNVAETQAKYIREATQATIDALIVAIVLAILVIFPFLRNFQATLITALAIPTSLLGTTIVMAIAGFNLETITLLALALVIGIVVDDAIVDVENITRHIEKGEHPKEAAIKGTDEIGLPVTASTLTIAAVFLPVAFMQSSVGQFFKPFALTVSAAVLFSLLVARTLSPVLAVYWLQGNGNRKWGREDAEMPRSAEEKKVETQSIASRGQGDNPRSPITIYRNLLRWSLHHRKIVIGIALLSFVAGIALIPLIPKGFVPKLDRGEFNIIYTAPLPKIAGQISNTPLPPLKKEEIPHPKSNDGAFGWIEDLAKSPERLLLRKTIKVGTELENVVLKFPEVESVFTTAGLRGEPNKGKLYVRLRSDRQITTARSQENIRAALPSLKGVSVSIEDLPFIQTEAEKPLQIAILGDNFQLLRQSAQDLKTRVVPLPGLKDVELSGKELQGDKILEIERLNGQPVVYLSANLAQKQGLEDAALQIEKIARSRLPQGITLKRWGNSAHSSDVLGSFGGTMAISVVLMLSLLLLLFGRWLEPLVVGLSLPLSIVGAMFGLLVTQSDFGVISLIGLIFLLGLLDKNALLLMDSVNQLRQSGWSREEAIVETGVVRLRPIIMTTASTILGMLPIALGWGAGAELRQPMAVAIVGGLIASSLLSSIVIPVLLYVARRYCRKQSIS